MLDTSQPVSTKNHPVGVKYFITLGFYISIYKVYPKVVTRVYCNYDYYE